MTCKSHVRSTSCHAESGGKVVLHRGHESIPFIIFGEQFLTLRGFRSALIIDEVEGASPDSNGQKRHSFYQCLGSILGPVAGSHLSLLLASPSLQRRDRVFAGPWRFVVVHSRWWLPSRQFEPGHFLPECVPFITKLYHYTGAMHLRCFHREAS